METIKIFSREEHMAIRTQWLAHLGVSRKNSVWPMNCLLYALIRDKNPRKAFSPITNPTRLERVLRENNASAWKALYDCFSALKHALLHVKKIRNAKAGIPSEGVSIQFTGYQISCVAYLIKQSSQMSFDEYEFNLTDAQIEYLLTKIEDIK